MTFYVPVEAVIANMIAALQAVTDFALVRSYMGEFSRYQKKDQMTQETFPVEVNLASPFALVSSQDRPVKSQSNRRLQLEHHLSVFIGVQNRHDFSDAQIAAISSLLDKCANTLVGGKYHEHASRLTLVNAGTFLARTDLFIVYEQKFSQLEPADQ